MERVFDLSKLSNEIELNIPENPQISVLQEKANKFENVGMFNELNTAFEKLGIDRIVHTLRNSFEIDLDLINKNIKKFIDILESFGIVLTANDFKYSPESNEYMREFFEENINDKLNSEKLKKTFEALYCKCPDIVTHIELDIRHLYYINSKKIEQNLENRNERILLEKGTDKNGLVKEFFEVNKELIKLKKRDIKFILNKFVKEEWKAQDFNDKEMSILYDRMYTKDYYGATEEEKEKIDNNFEKLLHTLQEYNIYIRYKYIIDDIIAKYKIKDTFKGFYEAKNREIRKKEQEILKETEKSKKLVKKSKNPFLIFLRKKFERKIYELPNIINAEIKELKQLYLELDEAAVNEKIAEFVDDNCTIKYMFKIATSYYIYAYELVRKHYKDDTGVNIADELQVLIDFINQPYKVMLNNIRLIEEPDICSIISNRYKLLNIALEEEDLEEENIKYLLTDVEKIVNSYNVRKSGLKIDDIEKAKLMLSKKTDF